MVLEAVQPPVVPNPKRTTNRRGEFYSYYAGYSEEFVEGALAFLNLNKQSVVLDPWNGSGTTSHVAQRLGYDAFGYDINPAVVAVAKARSLGPGVKDSLDSLASDITQKAELGYLTLKDDPLNAWASGRTAATVRSLRQAIVTLLVDGRDSDPSIPTDVSQLSDLAAFFFLALFRTVRQLFRPFLASNPTWVKIPKDIAQRVDIEPKKVIEIFQSQLHTQKLHLVRPVSVEHQGTCKVEVASSTNLPLESATVDAVVSSPPYCTRIDYAIATLPELAVLGFPISDRLRDLRRCMIGAPVIWEEELDVDPVWGRTCEALLNDVEEHHTKASDSYYLKNLTQYFSGIFASLGEIDRVLTPHGKCCLVVQDSFYKDLHVDLPQIFSEMAANFAWKLSERVDFRKSTIMGRINPRTKPYRSNFRATETVLIFEKT